MMKMFSLSLLMTSGILIFLTSCPRSDAFDQIQSESRLTKMEVIGIVKEWCEADPWMVSLMKRMIDCRNGYMKENPERQKKMEECVMKNMAGLKIDPATLNFKPDMLNTEEGERNITCTILKKDPQDMMKIYGTVFTCMEPQEESMTKYRTHMSTCMSKKAREEEAAYEKEQAEKAAKKA